MHQHEAELKLSAFFLHDGIQHKAVEEAEQGSYGNKAAYYQRGEAFDKTGLPEGDEHQWNKRSGGHDNKQ